MIAFETLDHLQNQHWALLSDFLNENELTQLKTAAVERWQKGQFEPAKVGRSQDRQRAENVRSDWTSWVDLQDPQFSWLAKKLEELMSEFNRHFYLGIRQFEGHFARYEKGQFYEEHIDQSPTSSPLHGERVITFVLYLNENWQVGDGGELKMRLPEGEKKIEPRWGHLVLFLSDTIPHAVLPALKERWSLTGWFRRA